MEPFFADYLSRLESLHNDIKVSLAGLPQAGVDWTPGAGMNSLCVLVVHVTGAERYWIGDVVAGEPSGRVREAEFRAQGIDAALLADKLDSNLAYAHAVLERLQLVDLEKKRVSPRDGSESNVGWALDHILAHTGLHAGHSQLTRQLWEQREHTG